MINDLKGFSFKLRLIQVTLFDPNQQQTLFTLSIINKYNQYNTSPFHLANKIIDLKQCAPISISMEESENSLVKISLNSCNDSSSYDTQIDYKIIQTIVNGGRKPQAKKKRHILAFPMFGRSRVVYGQLKIKLSIIQQALNHQPFQQITLQKKSQRQMIFSQSEDDDYFQPAYSRFIKVKIDDSKDGLQLHQNAKQQQIYPKGFQKRQSMKYDNFEPFKEQISLIQMRNSNYGKQNEQQQCEMVQFACNSNIKTPKRQESVEQVQQIGDIPQDCRYLFQKINEINRRYAPLQRIPSQEQFSQDSHGLNQQDCRIESDLNLSNDQISHPLQQVEQLLKQLDLIKFAQTLQQPQGSKA